jgi:hypothetical protein
MLGDGFALGVPFTALLAAGSVLVPLQNHHLVLSLWTHTQQTWRWGVCAAAFALLSVAALPLLWPSLGVWSAVAVMAMAEFAWVGVVRWGVGRLADPPKGRNPLMSRALGVPLAAMVSAVLADGLMQGAAAWGAGFIDSSPTPTRLVLCWAAAAFGVWFALRLRPVWSSAEQSVLLACLPGSWAEWAEACAHEHTRPAVPPTSTCAALDCIGACRPAGHLGLCAWQWSAER